MRIALYPGSFDPVTVGHMDIIARAAALFDRVVVGVLHNPAKPSGVFTPAERVQLLLDSVAGLDNVEVRMFSGLLVDAARACGARIVVRGLRTMADAEVELQMARINRQIGDVETLFLAASPQVMHVSSEMVRQVGRYGGDLRGMLPGAIEKRVAGALARAKQ